MKPIIRNKAAMAAALAIAVIYSVLSQTDEHEPEHPEYNDSLESYTEETISAISEDDIPIESILTGNRVSDHTEYAKEIKSSKTTDENQPVTVYVPHTKYIYETRTIPPGETSEKRETEERPPVSSAVSTADAPDTTRVYLPETETVIVIIPVEDTGEPPGTQTLHVVSLTEKVENNSYASITVQGKPNTEYVISVHYPSGISKADGLEPKTSDENGCVTWSWKVGARTTAKKHKIVVSGGGERIDTEFETYK